MTKHNIQFGVKLQQTNVNNISRVLAYLIDWWIASMLAGIPIALIGSAVLHTTDVRMVLADLPLKWGVIAGVLAMICYLGYYFVMELHVYKGQTFGKRIMKLKVVKDDGSDVDFMAVFKREVIGAMIIEGYIANSSSFLRQIAQLFTDVNIMDMAVYLFGIISAISILMGMASASRKMIHDHIAKTHLVSAAEA
ncbi:RDD family protein [uncultured Dubosiella sp.]|uniref:RDD family protein n=1 Tax=uncultured Dubosiella sp. TaxID=1937011 RepID=UPI0027320898|nr:RDD family protein [uncultured Dubosiella sp.]